MSPPPRRTLRARPAPPARQGLRRRSQAQILIEVQSVVCHALRIRESLLGEPSISQLILLFLPTALRQGLSL